MVNCDSQDDVVSKKAQKKGLSPKTAPEEVATSQATKPSPSPDNNPPTSQLLAAKGPLKIQHYPDGSTFTTILPDMTGQCYYASGRIAILIYKLYQGTLGYLVFEDDDSHTLLATLVESGQATCYGVNGTIRLVLTPCQGVIFDDNQLVKRKWTWMGGAALFQPISLQLNKTTVIRCSQQDNIVLNFSAANNHAKFFIGRKQKALPGLKPEGQEDSSSGSLLESHLCEAKAKISTLLGKLQYTQKLQRVHGVKT